MAAVQVAHIVPRPILLLEGEEMWSELMKWIKRWPLKMELMSPEDLENITICKSVDDVLNQLIPSIDDFRNKAKGSSQKYQVFLKG